MKKFSLVLLASILMVSVAFVSCDKDDDIDEPRDSEFTYEEVNYELTQGLLEYYGHWGEGTYNFDVILFSSGIVYDAVAFDATGVGELVYFEMFSSSATELMDGTYTFSNTGAANTFDIGDFAINYDIENETYGHEGEIASGTVKIEKDGDTYKITIDCVDTEGKDITGYYEGTLTYVDHNAKSTTHKKNSILK